MQIFAITANAIYQVQANPKYFNNNTVKILNTSPTAILIELNSRSNLLKMNRLNSPPYVNDAICSPIITIASFPSSNNNAIPIKIAAQTRLTNRDNFNDFVFFTQSLIVDDASELIDELKVDIAEESTPANNSPFNPTGKYCAIKVGNSRSFSISIPPK